MWTRREAEMTVSALTTKSEQALTEQFAALWREATAAPSPAVEETRKGAVS